MTRSRKRWIMAAVALALVFVGAAVASRRLQPARVPDGIAWGNGRIEAREVDIATKRPGRVAEVLVDEGATITAGQVLARMTDEDLDADLREAQARLDAAREDEHHAAAILSQRESEHTLAEKEFGRADDLTRKGLVAKQTFDEAQSRLQMADAARRATQAQAVQAGAAVRAATARMERIATDIADAVLTAPVGGRVLYRLAEPGEILPAGGRVLTVLDLSDVYMTIFLPMRDAGRAAIGAEARIVLDARPDLAIPARLSFVAPTAQFTPKEVETASEREKLMFRAKVSIDATALAEVTASLNTGMPGLAYVRVTTDAAWPTRVASARER